MTTNPSEPRSAHSLRTERLTLRPVALPDIDAIRNGARMEDWAEDFPQPEENDILLSYANDSDFDASSVWGQSLIVEQQTSTVIGTIGMAGPPIDGCAEITCAIVPSRRNQGLATEVTMALTSHLLELDRVDCVRASTPWDAPIPQQVLLNAGFEPVDLGEDAIEREFRRMA